MIVELTLTCRSDYVVYNKGSSDDFDRWANVTGDPGWSWNALQPYMKKVWSNLIPFIAFVGLLIEGARTNG